LAQLGARHPQMPQDSARQAAQGAAELPPAHLLLAEQPACLDPPRHSGAARVGQAVRQRDQRDAVCLQRGVGPTAHSGHRPEEVVRGEGGRREEGRLLRKQALLQVLEAALEEGPAALTPAEVRGSRTAGGRGQGVDGVLWCVAVVGGACEGAEQEGPSAGNGARE
jgi:hypothetical protein